MSEKLALPQSALKLESASLELDLRSNSSVTKFFDSRSTSGVYWTKSWIMSFTIVFAKLKPSGSLKN